MTKVKHGHRNGHGPFYRPAVWLYRKLKGRVKSPDRELICGIYGETRAEEKYDAFQIQKVEKLMTIAAVGMLCSAALTFLSPDADGGARITFLKRPKSGVQTYTLSARVGEETARGIRVEVEERKPGAAERRSLLMRAAEELELLMESENAPLDGICADMFLPSSLAGGAVEVSWRSDKYDLVDSSGHVRNETTAESGETATLRAVLTCGEEEKEVTYPIRVLPAGRDLSARLTRETARRLKEEENGQSALETCPLPDTYQGTPIVWQKEEPMYGIWAAGFTVIACVLMNAAAKRDLMEEGKKRQEALLASYPSFLSRLTLLVGAGMPVRSVFGRIAAEQPEGDREQIHEEVLRTCREMESGLTEAQAYENFGKRCRLVQYRKCVSLLVQNLKKGTEGLTGVLNQEAVNAFEERKAMAKRKGEEAQTKLLLPMLMMLLVVMILIMVPACFSFSLM